MDNSFFSQVWRRRSGRIIVILLGLLYLIAFLAPVLSPYLPSDQDLKKTYHPPTRVTWNDGPAVQIYHLVDPTAAKYEPVPGQTAPIHFWAKRSRVYLLGFIPCDHRLFAVDPPQRIFLLGSDSTGRDVFSRLVYGSRVSLTIGLVGIALTNLLGVAVGCVAGYFGGWVDNISMRFTEIIMAVPGLYLIIALRAALAKSFDPNNAFLLIVVILSAIGWAGTARVIRGLTLSLRERPFIAASQALGQSSGGVITRHILVNLSSYLIVTSTLSIPGYILGEASLSYLGLGIQEPGTSWGLMLSQANEIKVFMLNFWWLLTPGLAILVTVVLFNMLGDIARDIVDPRFRAQP